MSEDDEEFELRHGHPRWVAFLGCLNCTVDAQRARFRRSDGTWSCVRDHRTEPCGDCDGCREAEADRLAGAAR